MRAAPLRSDADVSFWREEPPVTTITNDAVSVGDERTEEFPPLTRTMFVRYAGASGDFNPMHHDDTIATQVGNPSVFGHGMLTMGLAARVVKDWFGPEAIRRLQVRFAKQVWPGDVLTCKVVVTGKRDEGGEHLVDLDLVVANQDGVQAITGSATAAVG
jgi:acyl dehydratase